MQKHTETFSAAQLRGVISNYKNGVKIQASEMQVLRTIRVIITRRDRTCNTRTREDLQVLQFLKEIERF